MAILILTKLWVNLMSTGAAVSAQSRDRPRSHGIEGKVETFAGGRQRSISSVGEKGEFGFTLVYVPESSITTLRSWEGQIVEVRDHRGQRYVGTFYKLNIEEIKSELGLYNVGITLFFVTFEEGA